MPHSGLPFRLLALAQPLEEDTETDDVFHTREAWVADIHDLRHIKDMIKWAENSHLSDGSLDHLRSIRKGNDTDSSSSIASILLAPSFPDFPFPVSLETIPRELSKPYKTLVPSYPSRTPAQIKAKNLVWPCLYQPRRPSDTEAHNWTKIEIDWIANCMQRVLNDAQKARDTGDFGISSLAASFEHPDIQFAAHDTRRSTHHPLRHSVMNVIRQVADFQAEQNTATVLFMPQGSSGVAAAESAPVSESRSSPPIPFSYLLTNMTLFTNYEPCIMCSMALVHSRVTRIFFLKNMPLTGGCGGFVGVAGGTGVNHRYDIYQWLGDGRDSEREDKGDHPEDQDTLDESIDA